MTTAVAIVGRDTGGKSINLAQLQEELEVAGMDVSAGLGLLEDQVHTYDDQGAPADFASVDQAAVDQAITDHIALRAKTDEEYAEEFQDAATTAVRRQEIRDITAGLLPREQVRVDTGLPLEDPQPEEDPLEMIKAVPLGSTTDELRDAIVVYLERFGG
jgi:hypothetical protein